MIGLFKAPPAIAYLASLIAVADANTYIALVMGAVALIFGPRALRIRDLKARNEELNKALVEGHTIGKTHEERKTQLEADLRGAQERANLAEARARALLAEAAEWHKLYDERAAGASLQEVRDVLIQVIERGDKRHAETIDLIRQLASERAVTHP